MRLSSALMATRGHDNNHVLILAPIKNLFRIIVVGDLQRRKSGKVDTQTIRQSLLKGYLSASP